MKHKSTGLLVHERLKQMVKHYGVMMTGVSAEVVGQNQAEISVGTIIKIGDISKNISRTVEDVALDMIKPTNSCGQASNDVCALLLGVEEAKKLEQSNYQILSGTGDNLTSALKNTNLLIRFEVDRADYPMTLIKIKNKDFNPNTADRNAIYLVESTLFFLDKNGELFDLGQSEKNCNQLFNAIGDGTKHSLYFPWDPTDDEERAICNIAKIFDDQKHQFDCWLGSHSFTVFAPKALNDSSRPWYPYQAYFGSHSLQEWFLGDKDERFSTMGSEPYIKKLALLGTTTDIKVRSDIYAELFAKPGREKGFCIGVHEKNQQVRVKFKLAEVDPDVSLSNLEEVQNFIDQHPGEYALDKVESYEKNAKTAMTEKLESLLLKNSVVNKENSYLFWKNDKTVISPGLEILTPNQDQPKFNLKI